MIQRIAVIGAGTMGHSIAETFAIYGYDVNVFDTNENRLRRAKKEIEEELKLLIEEGVLKPDALMEILERIKFITDLNKTVEDRDYIIEAIPEVLELKQQLFKQLDEYCPKQTIFASNTSSLQLNRIMEFVSEERKERIIINHWFNPGHLIPLVELSYFGNMPETIYKEVDKLYKSINKQTVKILKNVPGLVANRIQQAVAREVFSIIEMEVADSEDIDKALKFGPAFRYATTGQLEIADLGGLDLWCTVGDNLLKDMDISQCSNKVLRDKVEEGRLGIKSGKGFYEYDQDGIYEIKKSFNKRLINQLKASEYYFE